MGKYLKFREISCGSADVKTVALAKEIEEATANSGDTYVTVTLSDGEDCIQAKMWSSSKKTLLFGVGDLISVILDKKIYRNAESYILKRTEDAPPDVKKTDFIIHSPDEPELLYTRTLENVARGSSMIDKTGNSLYDLADLVKGIYEENKEKLLYWSAAKAMHHDMYGGLLYHTYCMTRSALSLVVAYKDYYNIDAEVLLAGVALHDIGKLRELETTSLGSADYTVDGNLFGHLLLGCMMVQEYVTKMTQTYGENAFDPIKVKHLLHLIASHHGKLEWGAIREPATLEARMLAFVDDNDAKIFQMDRARNTVEPNEVTANIFGVGRVWRPY